MSLHDWTRVPAGLFLDFHQSWSIRIKDTLNSGLLPEGVLALVEQRAGPKEADVLAIESGDWADAANRDHAVATIDRPLTRIVRRASGADYSQRANRIVIKHHLGRTIAVIEIISPRNEDSRVALRDFLEKTTEFLRAGIHVLVIDLLPPTSRDPDGIHKVICLLFVLSIDSCGPTKLQPELSLWMPPRRPVSGSRTRRQRRGISAKAAM